GQLEEFKGPAANIWVQSGPWHSWGAMYPRSGSFLGPSMQYAIGKKMLISMEDTGLSEAQFSLVAGGTTDLDRTDVHASCTFANHACTIVLNHENGFVTRFDATFNAGEMAAHGPDTSELRGAFTCAESCARGSLSGFGIVLVW